MIRNRDGEQVCVVVGPGQRGLAFVMHGLGGFKEQLHIRVLTEVLAAQGYTVISFDTTHTFGESDGDYADATVTNAYTDLEDVIAWAATQPWYQEPFLLTGQSMGGICTALYAEEHPEKVAALAPIAPLVSGQRSYDYQTKHDPEKLKKWQETGWDIRPSYSKPGVMKYLKWSHMEDRMRYSLLPHAAKLTMPVLIVVGRDDTSCPVEDQQLLFDALPSQKQLEIIEGMGHNPRSDEHLEELRDIFEGWVSKLPSLL